MPDLTQTCALSGEAFVITEADQAYYAKRGLPLPKLCPRERLRRRLQFRNERKLFVRQCDISGRSIVSNVRPDAPFPVYHLDEWHKQNFEVPQLESFDFSKTFAEQFAELWAKAPRMHKASAGNEENSEYSNHCGNCRNCYFIFNSEEDEDCMYLKFGDKSRDCVDCHNILSSELCYECVNVKNGYRLFYSDDCESCSDSAFLRNCRGVRDSMFCYGLQHKQYCLFNEQLDKETYEARIKEYGLDSYANVQRCKQIWEEFSAQWPKIRHIVMNSENASGESIYNSRNVQNAYSVSDCEDCRYILNAVDVKDSYDFFAYGMKTALCHEAVTIANCYDLKFSTYCMYSNFLEYSDNCWSCEYCFGCVGLKGKKYCIFNKQYTEEEYHRLVPQIRQHMIQTGEYGEFFDPRFSMFPYEDSLAQDYFPVQSSRAAAAVPAGTLSVDQLPDRIADATPSLSQETFWCPEEQKAFRFQANEIRFYKRMGLAMPRLSFEARYRRRNTLIPFPY